MIEIMNRRLDLEARLPRDAAEALEWAEEREDRAAEARESGKFLVWARELELSAKLLRQFAELESNPQVWRKGHG